MKVIDFKPDIYKKLQFIKKKDKKLYKKIVKQLDLFEQDPKHKSLRLHKLTGEVENTWSISIDMSLRMVYIEKEDSYYFIKIGTHDQVYRLK